MSEPDTTDDQIAGIERANEGKSSATSLGDDLLKSSESLEAQTEAFNQQRVDRAKEEKD